jgi:hypothetical protein
MSDSTTRYFGSGESRSAAIVALQWLRERYPQARIATHVLPSDEALIAVRVSIKTPDGPRATGHGVAPGIEEAEDRGVVRAIESMGYIAPVIPERAPEPAVSEAPVSRPEPIVRPTPISEEPAVEPKPVKPVTELPRNAPTPSEPSRSTSANPAPLAGKSGQMGPPVMVRPRQPVRPAQPRGGLHTVPDPAEDEPRLEDVSWTEFWKWARPRGFESRESVIEAIGETIDGMTPREVREALVAFLGTEGD